ncbi:MAG: hypothetical protein CMH55_08575 [Myxococcales bacterium]|nr:hypothetical protein [Myxococcales bacterium]
MRVVCLLLICAGACRMPAGAEVPLLTEELRIDFGSQIDPTVLASVGGSWRVENGVLRSLGEENRFPLWLQRKVPDSFEVEFEMMGRDLPDGKLEFCGDGVRHESGYISILGGWGNSLAVIAKEDEHETGRTRKKGKWDPGHWYQWKVRRSLHGGSGLIEWFLDGRPFMQRTDKKPLVGPGHDRLGFNNWKTDLHIRNIRVRPLKGR